MNLYAVVNELRKEAARIVKVCDTINTTVVLIAVEKREREMPPLIDPVPVSAAEEETL